MLCLWEAQFGDFANGAQTINRSVHRFGGIEMATPERHRSSPPARLRGPGPGAFQRTTGTFPPGLRGGKYPSLQSHHGGPVFPCSASPNEARLRQAAYHHDAEKSAPLGAGFLPHGGLYERTFLGSFARAGSRAADKIDRVILCSGKIYYDLLSHREQEKINTAAIVRLEQLYPLAEQKLRAALKPFTEARKVIWCQEESQNMGAWTFIEPRLRALLGRDILYAGRNASASPAVGAWPCTSSNRLV